MANTIMQKMDKEHKAQKPNANVNDLVKRWRGKEQDQDPEYYDTFFKTYKDWPND